MKVERRRFLKGLAGAGAGLAAAPLLSDEALARATKTLKEEHIGMLYDATKCIGCKACETACKKANNLPIEYDEDGIYDAPLDLSDKTMNLIALYEDGEERSFVKKQCMHCVDPSCVSACPTKALNKQPNGIVTWDIHACVGCRYCQMNCPFNIPKYEYNNYYGKIVKCELCFTTNLPERGQPACTEICPTGAVKFGKVTELLAEAKERIHQFPDRYIPHIYGETEGGGTSVLYLSKVEFEKLGLPDLPEYSDASVSESIQHTLYQGLIAPIVIYGGLATIAYRNRIHDKEEK